MILYWVLRSGDDNIMCRIVDTGQRSKGYIIFPMPPCVCGTTFLNRRRPSRWTVSFKSRVLRYVFLWRASRQRDDIFSNKCQRTSLSWLNPLLYKYACDCTPVGVLSIEPLRSRIVVGITILDLHNNIIIQLARWRPYNIERKQIFLKTSQRYLGGYGAGRGGMGPLTYR